MLRIGDSSSREDWAVLADQPMMRVGFQTFSLTSQYAALYALNIRSALSSFFSRTFFKNEI